MTEQSPEPLLNYECSCGKSYQHPMQRTACMSQHLTDATKQTSADELAQIAKDASVDHPTDRMFCTKGHGRQHNKVCPKCAELAALRARIESQAAEIARLDAARIAAINAHTKAFEEREQLQRQFGDCAPYLKEHETVAECLQRNRDDTSQVLGMLAKERGLLEQATAKLTKVMGHPSVSLSTYEAKVAELEATVASQAEALRRATDVDHWMSIIGHGDTAHQSWLRAKLDEVFAARETEQEKGGYGCTWEQCIVPCQSQAEHDSKAEQEKPE